MKKLSALVTILCLLAATALANTTHYNVAIPVVGGSQNTWGSIINTAFGAFDGFIWSASSGTTIGVNTASSASNITLTNPMNNVQNITLTTTSKKLILPAMNATASPVAGGTIVVNNVGSNTFAVDAADGTTAVAASVAAGQSVTILVTSNATSNGAFTVLGPYVTSVTGNISLGTTASVTNPSISTDATTGLYTAGAAKVDVSVSGSKIVEWASTGETLTGTFTVSGLATMSGAATVGTTLGVAGNFSVNTNKFTVTAASGDTLVAGTLNVTGQATLGGVTYPASMTSGGVLYASSTSSLASSGALTANAVVLGGGAGGSPTVVSGLGTAGQVLTSNGAGSAPTFQTVGASGTPLYGHTGSTKTSPHLIVDTGTMPGGSTNTLTVTLSGSAVYTSSTSYTCSCTDQTNTGLVCTAQNVSGSSVGFNINLNNTDTIQYSCVGN